MTRDFNLPPGVTPDDVDPPETDEETERVERELDRADMGRDLVLRD